LGGGRDINASYGDWVASPNIRPMSMAKPTDTAQVKPWWRRCAVGEPAIEELSWLEPRTAEDVTAEKDENASAAYWPRRLINSKTTIEVEAMLTTFRR